jgi:hypothetical protein
MARVHVSVEIDANAAQVWSYVEPVELHVDWMSDAVAIRFLSEQHRGVGTRFECDTKIGPLKLTDIMEITDWVPEHTMGVQHEGVVTGAGVFTLTAIDLGRRTRFSWTEELRFPWWLAGPIGASIGGKTVLTLMWNRNLKALKEQIEAHVGAGSGTAS